MKNIIFILAFTALSVKSYSQAYPIFGNEISVTINGLIFGVQDPFISSDGNTLVFNDANSVPNMNLYYATKVNDSTFNYVGQIAGANETTPNHRNLSSSMDSSNNYFWTTLRNYNPPTSYESLMHGTYNSGNVTSIRKIYGDIYITIPNWIVMDAEISYDGNYLYYDNAYFGSGCGNSCNPQLNIAQKVNDSTFNKLPNSAAILSNVNDTNYLIYVPQITKDGLELYFTRGSTITGNTEICVAVRNSPVDTFSLPSVLVSQNGWLPEAPSLTTNKNILYYHKENGYMSGYFKIFMRYRTGTTGITESNKNKVVSIFPNPFSTQTILHTDNFLQNATLTVDNCFGQTVKQIKNISGQTVTFSRDNLQSGLYFLRLTQDSKVVATKKIIITD